MELAYCGAIGKRGKQILMCKKRKKNSTDETDYSEFLGSITIANYTGIEIII